MFLSFFFKSISIFCIVILLACCIRNSQENDDSARLWLNYDKLLDRWDMLDWEDVAYSTIPDDREIEYIDLLENVSFVELDKDEYYNLTGKILEKKYGIAIRAVYIQKGGNFDVAKSNENEYYVGYSVLGSRASKLNKTVLIIDVDELPIELFVEYSIAK